MEFFFPTKLEVFAKKFLRDINKMRVRFKPSKPYLSESLTKEEIEELQRTRLIALLQHASSRFSFWHDRIQQAGVLKSNGDIDLSCFHALPLLERSDVLEQSARLADESWEDSTWWDQSGGSTGEPVRILKDSASVRAMRRAKRQMHNWAGHYPHMPVVELWGAERDILEQRHRPPYWEWPLSKRLGCNKLVQNAFRMGEEQMYQYLLEWHWFQPNTIVAYAHSIHELARFAERNNIKTYRPQAIITSAGTLTSDMRSDIRRVFGAPVYNRYGSREFGNLAMSCEQEGGLHVIPTVAMIEIIRTDGSSAEPGELGEIVVTSLTARAMPLIRYRIGDMATWAKNKCDCGRQLPLIDEIKGRVNDQFIRIDGGFCTGDYFTHMMKNEPGVLKYQVIQEKLTLVKFFIVASNAFEKERTEQRLTYITKKAIGEGCEVCFVYTGNIEPNATGKHRFTISLVDR